MFYNYFVLLTDNYEVYKPAIKQYPDGALHSGWLGDIGRSSLPRVGCVVAFIFPPYPRN